MIDDLVKRLKETNITVLSQEIYQNDPFARVENLKVKLIIVNVDAVSTLCILSQFKSYVFLKSLKTVKTHIKCQITQRFVKVYTVC